MTDQPTTSAPPSAPRKSSRSPRLIWLAVALIVVVGLVTWLVTSDDDNGKASQAPTVKTGVPTVLSEAELRAFGRAQATPVYWAGPQPNRRYEMTRTSGGQYYVRYLTPKADVGSRQTRFVTVGTYPGSNAYGALQTVGRRKGSVRVRTRSGALVVWARADPRSVYFSFPQANFQVEVYAPGKGRARSLVLDGRVARLR